MSQNGIWYIYTLVDTIDILKTIRVKMYKLRNWVELEKLNLEGLATNPNSIDLFATFAERLETEKNKNPLHSSTAMQLPIWNWLVVNENSSLFFQRFRTYIPWDYIACGPAATILSNEDYHKINWRYASISSNPHAIALLEVNQDCIDWDHLSSNPAAVHLLQQQFDTERRNRAKNTLLNWEGISSNPNAIKLLEIQYQLELNGQSKPRLDWDEISGNPGAITLITHQLTVDANRINWLKLSANPNAIELLKANQYRINWDRLSANPNAIELLETNKDRINWRALSTNPSIFVYESTTTIKPRLINKSSRYKQFDKLSLNIFPTKMINNMYSLIASEVGIVGH